MEELYHRTEMIIGKEKIEMLKTKHICVCGIGGVGSYALEALARIGVGTITIIDKDTVDITNINRQLIALHSTIGRDKVVVAKERIQDINPTILVNAMKEEITEDTMKQVLKQKVDYVLDCVDSIPAKLAIITSCHNNGTKIISCMGMGNKKDPNQIKVAFIEKTQVCPLARIMRKKLKELAIPNVKVVYSTEIPIKASGEYVTTLGSLAFVPSVAGLFLVSEVIHEMLEI